MPPFVVALMLAAGTAAFVYNRSMKRTGNNTQTSAIAAGVTSVIAFFIMLTVISIANQLTSN